MGIQSTGMICRVCRDFIGSTLGLQGLVGIIVGVYRVCRDHMGASGVWCLGLRFREGLRPQG